MRSWIWSLILAVATLGVFGATAPDAQAQRWRWGSWYPAYSYYYTPAYSNYYYTPGYYSYYPSYSSYYTPDYSYYTPSYSYSYTPGYSYYYTPGYTYSYTPGYASYYYGPGWGWRGRWWR
jgi:hypothetical protein